ncbi:MAG: hypothetical protein WBA07_33675 [Rivularia sp. (in: cyanobacteria)]
MVKVIKGRLQELNRIRQQKYSQAIDLIRNPPTIIRSTVNSLTTKTINTGRLLKEIINYDEWRNKDFFDLEIDFYKSPCEKLISLTYRVLHWKLPSILLFYRNKECRVKDDNIVPYEINCLASPKCEGNGRAIYIWAYTSTSFYTDFLKFNKAHALFWELQHTESTIEKVTFPVNKIINKTEDYRGDEVYAEIDFTVSYTFTANHDWNKARFEVESVSNKIEVKDKIVILGNYRKYSIGNPDTQGTAGAGYAYTDYSRFVNEDERFKNSRRIVLYPQSDDLIYSAANIAANEEGIAGVNTTPYRTGISDPISSYFDAFGFKVAKFKTNIETNLDIREQTRTALTFCEDGTIHQNQCLPNTPKPPPPPLPKMRCCPDNSALLKEILKIVKQNKKAIGYDDYPVSVPQSFISVDGKEKGSKNVESITQFFAWYIERFDEIVGEFEIPIEVEDSDLLKGGNQTVKFKLPNIAEAIAELFLMVMNINITNEVQLNVAMRTLTEAGADKQQNYKSAMMLDAIVEYLGFAYKDVPQKLPLTFTPGEEILTRILKETEVDVSTIEYADNMNLQRALLELLQSAAIIRAKHWKQVDQKKDVKSQILSNLLQNKDLISQFIKGLNLEELEDEINKINNEQNTP